MFIPASVSLSNVNVVQCVYYLRLSLELGPEV